MAQPGRGGRSWRAGGRHGRRGHPVGDSQRHRGGIDAGARRGNGASGPNSRRELEICRNFLQTGGCRFGTHCIYSHDLSSQRVSSAPRPQIAKGHEQTQEQLVAKANYLSWKRLIKEPPRANDIETMRSLWSGALEILDGDDRDWKQMLPRDLENEDYNGRQHIAALLSMKAPGPSFSTFLDPARSFVSVITHPAVLHCLSIDTSVGGLYNFISGTNGSRAIPFFQQFSKILIEQHLETGAAGTTLTLENTLHGILMALGELLRRERRAAFHDDLIDLVASMENIVEVSGLEQHSVTVYIVVNRIGELRTTIDRARRLLDEEESPEAHEVSTTVVTSTYPREIVVPRDRHDNDRMYITKIKILPTEDEIRSNHPEFLPSTDFSQPHFLTNQAERYLDTFFRLLRHDIFGELKEALGQLLVDIENVPSLVESPSLSLGGIRAYVNPRAQVTKISFSREHRRGLEAQISFPQPLPLRKKSPSERSKWWQDSKRLEEGSLLCFLFPNELKPSLLFFTVSEKCTDAREDFSLSSESHQATILTKLATRYQPDLDLLTRLSTQNIRGILVEFPGVVVATFIPILENIQNMAQSSRLPFRKWLLPHLNPITTHGADTLDIPPPAYARFPDFSYPLRSILKDAGDDLSICPTSAVNDHRLVDELEARTELDRDQCCALIGALTREYAFIQGPPGTGKSYLGVRLMRVLLDLPRGDMGPIIVVCYTNHALDQFLEHLVEIGIEKVIRIGGRSKSTILEGKNLRIVSQSEPKTGSERYLLGNTFSALEEQEKLIRSILTFLHTARKRPSWATLKRHLQLRHHRIYSQFLRHDEDGFTMVGAEPFDVWVYKKTVTPSGGQQQASLPARTVPLLLGIARTNVHTLALHERQVLVEFWVEELRTENTDELFELVEQANILRQKIINVHDDVDRRVLQTADVIGVTTTGLARRIAPLQHVRCKVIICEEAGEVMEPHMVSALLPTVEHFIQIGDHQQLRPQINNFKQLSLESQQGKAYQLDRSQFERLSVQPSGRPSFPVDQLTVQRRMRPEISTLIRETIYPRLTDHETTRVLPDVIGMRRNVFWLDHNNSEEGKQADLDQKSHSNVWEVDMTHALVRHVIRQGVYSSSEIAVLTPYGGQLQKLRARMCNDFEIVLSDRDQEALVQAGFDIKEPTSDSKDVTESSKPTRRPLQKKKLNELLRLATVDNFQGEEAKIIIISLVRSNDLHKVGFLKTTNRINVLLSRAQHGMYIIGNTETYSKVPMWARVLALLHEKNCVGEALELCCPRHKEDNILVAQPADFARLSPEGGCRLSCDKRLPDCGHRCEAKCHSDGMHLVFSCPQPCQRLHSPCNHSCRGKICGEDCGLCMVRCDNVQLPCGHSEDNVACHMTQDINKIRCGARLIKQVPACNHDVEVECWRDVSLTSFQCPVPCATALSCGHQCSGTCGQCNNNNGNEEPVIKHVPCQKLCGRPFGACNHVCSKTCHDGQDCGPCTTHCEVRCAHSRCPSVCSEPCAPCIEKCSWSCEHRGDCTLPCAAPCDRLPCNQRCSKDLSCGHQCPSICGETCPEGYCQKCSNRQDVRVDLLEMKSYEELDLNETPVIVLGCGHFFTTETLDGHMGMSDVYLQDGNGEFTGLRDVSGVLAGSIPRCPDCQRVVRQFATQRFNRVINRAVIDEMSKRFLVNGQTGLRELDQKVLLLEQSLEDTRKAIIDSVRPTNARVAHRHVPATHLYINQRLKSRYQDCRTVEKAINSFVDSVADSHQPAHKLHEATVHSARRQSIGHSMAALTFTDAVPHIERDRRVILGGRAARLKAEYVTLVDKFDIVGVLKSSPSANSIKISGGPPDQLVKPFFQVCKSFMDECHKENLYKLAVDASLYYARLARSYRSFCTANATDRVESSEKYVKTAKELLENARQLCAQPFQNAVVLRDAIAAELKLLGKEWYEEVTAEELATVKAAMVSGQAGIATHSGHWYNCQNGHPFAIGECGMPMELARCPECGAPIGGQSHQAVAGVTRAMEMER